MQKFTLTHTYLLALTLIAGSMISAYVLVDYKVRTSIDKASIINIAGMQRMLSQRLGLLANELINEEDRDVRIRLFDKYSASLQKFSDNHVFLHQLTELDTTSDSIKQLYAGDMGVDRRSRQFIALANDIRDLADNVTHVSTRQKNLTSQMIAIARNGFLNELDAVVQAYDKESSEAVADFMQLERLILGLGLFLLAIEAVFIFRPIVNTSAKRQKQLEKSNSELMEFSFRISHDLRAPISSSRGMVEIAREALEENDTQLATDVVGRIDSLLLRLETLIEDIITVTRNNLTVVEAEQVNLHSIVDDTMEEISAMPGYEKCEFEVNIDNDSDIYTKKLYLQQIVQNLLSNAVKYTSHQDGEHVPRISISLSRAGKDYELRVDDNGIGIPESCRDKVFGMFMRFHPGLSNGSGLGLYLTYQNALAIGGNLRYVPLEQGSRFALKFQSDKV